MLMFKPITGKLHEIPMIGSKTSGPWGGESASSP